MNSMILSFHPCLDADVHIILGDQPVDSRHRKLIQEASAIILPQGCTVGLFRVCSESGAILFPNYEKRFAYPGKRGQSVLFEKLALPHPDTLRWPSVRHFRKENPQGASPHGFPVVLKQDRSHESEGVYVADGQQSLQGALTALESAEGGTPAGFVSQPFIPSEGKVLRVVLLGGRVVSYWKRAPGPGEPIISLSRGAVLDHDWAEELQETGREQARLLSRDTGINLAAVDFLFPEGEAAPRPLILEINYYFGRRGLGGTEGFYRLLHRAVQEWLVKARLDAERVRLI